MPTREREPVRVLSRAQIEQFIQDGFVRIDRAFPRQLADEGRAILWRDLPCDPDDPATWTRPVIRLGHYGDEPFKRSVILSLCTPRKCIADPRLVFSRNRRCIQPSRSGSIGTTKTIRRSK